MARKREEQAEDGVSHGRGDAHAVLVGTYKGDQLKKWRGWYNYPISDSDFSRVEHVERVDGRARSPSAPQSHADHSCVTELWLFTGTKDFAATLAANHPNTNVINDDIHSFKEAV